MKLFAYRTSQASNLKEAMNDGAICYLGDFDDMEQVDRVKCAVIAAVDMMDDSEVCEFVINPVLVANTMV